MKKEKAMSVSTKRLDIEKENNNLTFTFKGDDLQSVYVFPSEIIEGVYVRNEVELGGCTTVLHVVVSFMNSTETYSFEITDVDEDGTNELVEFLVDFVK